MLVVDTVLGNIGEDEALALDVQAREKTGEVWWVELSFHDAQRRRLRAATARGEDVGIDVPRGTALRNGDVLYRAPDSTPLVAVAVAPAEAMAIRLAGVPPDDLFAFGVRLGHVLGNQHWPVRVKGDVVLTPVTIDRLVMETVLKTHGFQGLEWEFVSVEPGEVPTSMPHLEDHHG